MWQFDKTREHSGSLQVPRGTPYGQICNKTLINTGQRESEGRGQEEEGRDTLEVESILEDREKEGERN